MEHAHTNIVCVGVRALPQPTTVRMVGAGADAVGRLAIDAAPNGATKVMRYRRALIDGASYFFTVNLTDRSARLLVERIADLREVVRDVRRAHPFEIVAWVVLPDHLHAVWTLPDGDAEYATRWGLIKAGFSRRIPKDERIRASRARKGERGLWQRRFWEHLIRDERDRARHVDYIHYNPVKHGDVDRAIDWPYSTFHRYLRRGNVTEDWGVRDDDGGSFGEASQSWIAIHEDEPA